MSNFIPSFDAPYYFWQQMKQSLPPLGSYPPSVPPEVAYPDYGIRKYPALQGSNPPKLLKEPYINPNAIPLGSPTNNLPSNPTFYNPSESIRYLPEPMQKMVNYTFRMPSSSEIPSSRVLYTEPPAGSVRGLLPSSTSDSLLDMSKKIINEPIYSTPRLKSPDPFKWMGGGKSNMPFQYPQTNYKAPPMPFDLSGKDFMKFINESNFMRPPAIRNTGALTSGEIVTEAMPLLRNRYSLPAILGALALGGGIYALSNRNKWNNMGGTSNWGEHNTQSSQLQGSKTGAIPLPDSFLGVKYNQPTFTGFQAGQTQMPNTSIFDNLIKGIYELIYPPTDTTNTGFEAGQNQMPNISAGTQRLPKDYGLTGENMFNGQLVPSSPLSQAENAQLVKQRFADQKTKEEEARIQKIIEEQRGFDKKNIDYANQLWNSIANTGNAEQVLNMIKGITGINQNFSPASSELVNQKIKSGALTPEQAKEEMNYNRIMTERKMQDLLANSEAERALKQAQAGYFSGRNETTQAVNQQKTNVAQQKLSQQDRQFYAKLAEQSKLTDAKINDYMRRGDYLNMMLEYKNKALIEKTMNDIANKNEDAIGQVSPQYTQQMQGFVNNLQSQGSNAPSNDDKIDNAINEGLRNNITVQNIVDKANSDPNNPISQAIMRRLRQRGFVK